MSSGLFKNAIYKLCLGIVHSIYVKKIVVGPKREKYFRIS